MIERHGAGSALRWFDVPSERLLLRSANGDWCADELRACTAAITDRLRGEPGRVVIFGGLDPATLLCWLGAQLAGRVVTVIDRRLPVDLVRGFVACIDPTTVLCLEELTDLRAVVSDAIPMIDHGAVVDDLRRSFARGDLVDPGPLDAGHGPACTIFSSGSTGTPKEVLLSHAAIGAYARLGELVEPVAVDDVVAMVHPLSVVTGPNALAQAWRTGRAVAPYDIHRDSLAGLGPALISTRATHVVLQTSILRSLVRATDLRASALRVVIAGGEAVTTADLAAIDAVLPPATVLRSVFGMSECGVIGWRSFDRGAELSELRYRLTDGAEVVIVDDLGRTVPRGEVGEIKATGWRLADSHLIEGRAPDLAADRFVEDEGRRWFLTGDVGRLHDDGSLQVIGRADSRVKVRGYNVFPEAVERALRSMVQVRDAVVVGAPRAGGGTMLVAFVVSASQPAVSVGVVRRSLGALVADYCVPSIFVMTDELPALGNGKADRVKLRARAAELTFALRPDDAPRTEDERLVHDVVAGLLGLPNIGVHDDLLDLGLDSLMVGELAARLASGGAGPAIADMLCAPTIAGIAELVGPGNGTRPARAPELVRLAGSGNALRIVLIPGAGASVGYLRPLARLLARKGDVVGAVTGSATSVREEAAAIVAALGDGPAGSAVLVGHSWGAWIAQEAARQLIERGVEVSGVVLLDAVASARPTRSGALARRLAARVRHREAATKRGDDLRADDMYADDLRADDDQADAYRAIASAAGDRRYAWHLETLRWHRPRPVAVDAVLAVAASGHGAKPDAWRRWFRDVHVVEVSGTHASMLAEPHVGELAARLLEWWPR